MGTFRGISQYPWVRDVDALTALLHKDATLSMPPYTLWLRAHDAIRTWLLGRGSGCRGSRLGHRAWALIVLELSGDHIAGMTSFLDTETLFPLFGLPLDLPS